MNPFQTENLIEQRICNLADMNQIPISGTFELLPLCNMDCKMCFAKMSKAQMEKHRPMRGYQEWLEVARQARDAGMMFLLLTGGETFLYPDFQKLYCGLRKMGIVVSINTNGTLITEEIAEFLAKDPPRRVNLTLYGSSDETYKKLCGNPHGFSQATHGIKLLQERGVPIKLNCSVTPYNVDDLESIYAYAAEKKLPIETAYYMMPAIRENNLGNQDFRLDPRTAAEVKMRVRELQYPPAVLKDYVLGTLDRYRDYVPSGEVKKGFTCRAGNSVFWIDYDGMMRACSFTQEPSVQVFDRPFIQAWNEIKEGVSCVMLSSECLSCKMKTICSTCAASMCSETGVYSGTPKYHCELTARFIELLMEKEKEYGE
ncbi:MAG: radical SAM protein [Clostridia bacterium]|nr:radical SAM protein [Clostridia bacterium]